MSREKHLRPCPQWFWGEGAVFQISWV